ncbi:MAG TPA: carboxypeptidase regulatory-like domain-containing protein [Thermoanaerobaculia bacterium]|nr:carboxypeptidase regulatory-like domain-containing protein [Thermoanaerobaculia bacterium]
MNPFLFLAVVMISGTVQPGSMTVAAYDANGVLAASTTAASDGRYTLNVNSGQYRVLAYDPAGVYATSFYPNADSFESSTLLNVQSSTASINLTLVRGGALAGTVKSGTTPRPNITVAAYNLSGTRRGFTRTDAAGQYRIVVPPGEYRVAAYDDAQTYAPVVYPGTVSVTADHTTTLPFSLTLAAKITGTIRDATTQAALQDIRVTAYDSDGNAVATVRSDAGGHYSLAVPAGSYRLVFDDASAGVHASVYWTNAESFEMSTVLQVASGETRNAIDAAMTIGGRFEGSVIDGVLGTPVAGISVAAFNANGTTRARTTTDAAGHYSLLVPPGTYRLGAFDNALAYAAMFYPQQLVFAGATPVSVAASQRVAPLDFSLLPGGRVSGTVRDATTSVPVSGVTVGAFAAGTLIASATTRSDGSYRLVAPHGVFTILAFDPSLRYVTSSFGSLALASGQDATGVNFSLSPGAAVSGDVHDLTTRAPLSGITVSAFDAAGTELASAMTRDDGTFAFVVPAGTWRFAAADPQHRYTTSFYEAASSFDAARPITVIAGNPLTLAFRLSLAPQPSRRRSVRK